jgi:hypothetical protein
MHILRSVLCAVLTTGFIGEISPQDISYASKVLEYHPAPGQFINILSTGTPAAAQSLAGTIGNPLSLGGYGGFIVFGFDEPVKNNPEHPFGIDFIIAGNAMANSSEQGIVLLMKDINKNGLPDDTWYEIKGSDHYLSEYQSNYSIVYHNPGSNSDVPWIANNMTSGFIRKNQFQTQAYYPDPAIFTSINPDSIRFSGSLLADRIKVSNGIIESGRSYFGYADNTPFKILPLPVMPDNPYTPEIEGWGGDGIDISWAVDQKGTYVDLDEIDFVKIHTGVNYDANLLGEISTEVSGIVLTKPLPGVSGPLKSILPIHFPTAIPIGSSFTPEVLVLDKGRRSSNESVIWETSDKSIIDFQSGQFIINKTGNVNLTARLASDPSILFTSEIRVYRPSKFTISDQHLAIAIGKSKKVTYSLLDDAGYAVLGSSIQIEGNNSEHIQVSLSEQRNELIIIGLREGMSILNIFPDGNSELGKTIEVHVYEPMPQVSCRFTMRIENSVRIPRSIFNVTGMDFTQNIDRKPSDYVLPLGYISAASLITHVLLENGYNRAGKTFNFRIDEKSDYRLYLWQYAEYWEYLYGWGGSLAGNEYSSCWVLSLNGVVYTSGFDNIPIKNGDNASLIYVNDIRSGFEEKVIYEDTTYADAVSKKFRIIKYIHSLDANGKFNTFCVPIGNENLQVFSGENQLQTEYLTDSEGYVLIDFITPGSYLLKAESFPTEELMVTILPTNIYNIHPGIFGAFNNPYTNDLQIEINQAGDFVFQLYDITGKCLIERNLYRIGSEYVDMSDLKKGVYILKISGGNEIFTKRVLKE